MATAARLFAFRRSPGSLLRAAARSLARTPGDMCLISQVEAADAPLRPMVAAHQDPAADGVLARWLTAPARCRADAFSCEVQRTGRSLRVAVPNPRLLQLWLPAGLARLARELDVRQVLAAALIGPDGVVGTILLWRERRGRTFGDADELYVTALAARLGLGLTRAASRGA
jgi:GAF domain-containing protein